jgi:hypothetical protein
MQSEPRREPKNSGELGKKNPRNLKKMKKKKKNPSNRGKLSKRLKPNNSRHRKRRREKGRRSFTKKPNSTSKAIKERSFRDKVKNLKMRTMLFMTKLQRSLNRLDMSTIERPSDKRSGNFECEPINAKLRVKCQPINADLRVYCEPINADLRVYCEPITQIYVYSASTRNV